MIYLIIILGDNYEIRNRWIADRGVGKSTLFNAITKAGESANYPFTTIEPNVGLVDVPDERLNVLAQYNKSKIVPAFYRIL